MNFFTKWLFNHSSWYWHKKMNAPYNRDFALWLGRESGMGDCSDICDLIEKNKNDEETQE